MKKNIKKDDCACSCCNCSIFLKRFFICIILGIGFGFLCVYLASSNNPGIWGWNSALMWSIIFNRFLIGVFIAIIGVHYYHPFFCFRFYPVLRGILFGAIVSIQLAIGIFSSSIDSSLQIQIFWATIIAGAIYGLIIDVVASKFGGEGEELLCKK